MTHPRSFLSGIWIFGAFCDKFGKYYTRRHVVTLHPFEDSAPPNTGCCREPGMGKNTPSITSIRLLIYLSQLRHRFKTTAHKKDE